MNRFEKEQAVQTVVTSIYEDHPYLKEKFGQNGVERTEEDNFHHLDHLESAYEMGSNSLFLDYTNWLNTVLTSRGVGTYLIVDNFRRLLDYFKLGTLENDEEQRVYIQYLQEALQQLHTLSK